MREYEWSVLVHRDNIRNSNDTKHVHVDKHAKRNLRTMGAVKQRELPRMGRIRMDVEVSYPPRTYVDAANLHPTMKSYLDGMVSPNGKRERDHGFLVDDGDKYVDGPFLTWSGWPSGRDGWYLFRVKVTEVPEWVQPAKPAYL